MQPLSWRVPLTAKGTNLLTLRIRKYCCSRIIPGLFVYAICVHTEALRFTRSG
ncbi:hypothetical protein V8C42DRAFT_330263 [Trichoderma barbatum]